jgi:hypothetical protein
LFAAYQKAMAEFKEHHHNPGHKFPEERAAYIAAREKVRAAALGDLYQLGITLKVAPLPNRPKKPPQDKQVRLGTEAFTAYYAAVNAFEGPKSSPDFEKLKASLLGDLYRPGCTVRHDYDTSGRAIDEPRPCSQTSAGVKPPVKPPVKPQPKRIRRNRYQRRQAKAREAHQPWSHGEQVSARDPWQRQQGTISSYEAIELEHVAPHLTIRRGL